MDTIKKRVRQSDVPGHSFTEAILVAQALNDQYAGGPTKPILLAQAIDIKPSSSKFRSITGAAVAYGLTTGAYNSVSIGLTDLGRRCVAPTSEGDDIVAQREAMLKPRIIAEFLTKYNNHKMPSDSIGVNVLVEMGVSKEKAVHVLEMIKSDAQGRGLLKEVKNELYVDLDFDAPGSVEMYQDTTPHSNNASHIELEDIATMFEPSRDESSIETSPQATLVRRVFITHGNNIGIVEQLKKLLTFGKFEPVVSVEKQTAAKPVPQKVMDDMRSCSAAVIHVGKEKTVIGESGGTTHELNQNVLIEIGAAMALYGPKFILLVEEGAQLPSNLQGLYEVRYSGEKLDLDSAMKLLEAFNDFTA